MLVGPHRGSNLYNEARSQIISAIQTKCDKMSLINSEKITKLLTSGKQAYQEAYSRVMQRGVLGDSEGDQAPNEDQSNKEKKQDEPPISPKRLLDIHKAAIKAAQEAFENDVKAAGLPWVGPGDDQYDFHLYTCLQWSKKQFEKLRVCFSIRLLPCYSDLNYTTECKDFVTSLWAPVGCLVFLKLICVWR